MPLLLNFNNIIIEAPSDWLRYLRIIKCQPSSSVCQYAYHLKYWWSYLHQIKKSWDSASDDNLINWRDSLLTEGLNKNTVNGYLSTIFRMYLWSERNGYIKDIIGEADLSKGIIPQISVECLINSKGKSYIVSPLLVKTTAKPILPTPTNDEITKVHLALTELYGAKTHLIIRDSLILTWSELTGTRRSETLSLKKSDIPSWDQLFVLEEDGQKSEITIIGKGSKRRSIWADASLLMQTRDYIENERNFIVERFSKNKRINYYEPDSIFLSTKTGQSLRADSISQIFAKAFRKAKVKGSGHRVRARFLTNLVINAFESEFEKFGSIPDTVSTLLPIAQIAGHNNPETLKPYLAIAKKRLIQLTKTARTALIKEQTISSERRLNSIQARLGNLAEIKDLLKALESKNKNQIRDELKRLEYKYRS